MNFIDTFEAKYGGVWEIIKKPPEVGDFYIECWEGWQPMGGLVTFYDDEVRQIAKEGDLGHLPYQYVVVRWNERR